MKDYNGFTAAQRNRAQAWIDREIAAGRIDRPAACCVCGKTDGRFDLHAEDYGEPFGPQTVAFPVCSRCHWHIHNRDGHADRYAAYVDLVGRTAPSGADPSLLGRIGAGEFDPRSRK